jgi:coxsackievirus/adenovirus receptor
MFCVLVLVLGVEFKYFCVLGLVLYNGNEDTGKGDYVCFGLREGYPEFTFDVGSGPAIIQANETLKLNQWHTVRLERNRKTGLLRFPAN